MTTWDSSGHNQNVTFTNGDLTATAANTSNNWCQSTTSKTAGKQYVEFTAGASLGGFFAPGGGNNNFNIAQNIPGFDSGANSFAFGSGGTVFINGSDVAAGQGGFVSYAAGDVIALEWDIPNNQIRGNNLTAGTGWKGPITLTGMNTGTNYFIMWGSTATSGVSVTINFGGTAFTGTPEAGYSAWDTAAPTFTLMAQACL